MQITGQRIQDVGHGIPGKVRRNMIQIRRHAELWIKCTYSIQVQVKDALNGIHNAECRLYDSGYERDEEYRKQ
jgi:hypothetical protein